MRKQEEKLKNVENIFLPIAESKKIVNRNYMLTLKNYTSIFFAVLLSLNLFTCNGKNNKMLVYNVHYTADTLTIDADWDKPQWQKVKAVELHNYMGDKPQFWPKTEVKMLYNNRYLYVIFRVKDRYIKAVAKKINGPVYHDSTVELFFTPSENTSNGYFNLEVNCGGTPYFGFQKGFKKSVVNIDINDIKKIKIAHSLPQIISDEIKNPVTWTLEYKIPFQMLTKYTKVIMPEHGVVWKANIYKTADGTSNPHYLTWNKVVNDNPNFHLPNFFGTIYFQ